MTDTPEKRERKPFEPPPWEREQFEELRRRREAEAALRQEVEEEAAEEIAAQGDGAGAEPTEQTTPTSAEAVSSTELETQARPDAKDGSDAHVEEMLAQLGAEEPKVHNQLWLPNAAAAVVLGLTSAVFFVYAAMSLVKARGAGGPTVLLGEALLSSLGALMLVGAIWAGMRSSRQKRGER